MGPPFSRTVTPSCAAASRVAAIRSSPGADPVRAANSPSCGVTTVGAERAARSGSNSGDPRMGKASASTTAGMGSFSASTRRAAAASSRPSPGPTATQLNRSTLPVRGGSDLTTSMGTSPTADCGALRCNIRTPLRMAAAQVRAAAPPIPCEPATTSPASCHLWV